MHHLLRGDRAIDHHRWHGAGHTLHQKAAEALLPAAQQARDALAARQHADGHAGARMALHVVEDHGGAVHVRGARHRSASADVAVHTGELGGRIHLHVGLDELPGLGAQVGKRAAQVVDVRHGSASLGVMDVTGEGPCHAQRLSIQEKSASRS